ncbi:MAG: hypothetical protein A2Z04_04430 [Chloroflexi bacterium RBG_16_57_9]|nr:MAG: hypothetical protein A2Z04_04430 [Chloroflexi bacterium RBG_16_57_9]
MQQIEEIAEEGSSFYPTIEFLDEAGAAMTPTLLHWKLTDMKGNVINSRTQVEVAAPATSLTLPLGGGDLDVLGNDVIERLITAWGTYTSSTHGAGQTFLFQFKFNIQPRVGG